MNNFPFKLLGGMTALFIFLCIGMHLIFNAALDFMGVSIGAPQYLVISFVFSVLCFCLVSLYAVLPLNGAIKYLKLLLSQPKTENIRVAEEGFLQNFKYVEWGELGGLVLKVERKLRRRTKALLRETTELTAVMNSLDSPIVAINSRMDVAFLNSAFAVMFELSGDNLGRATGVKNIRDVISEEKIIETLEKAIKEESFESKMIAFILDERKRIFSVSMSPLRRGVDNSLYGVVASFNDETVKVELDQKRMDFVANASHELRTPIAAVSTSVSLLDKVDDEETKKQVMDSLSLNSDRLVRLAQDLLDLSKLEDEAEAEAFEAQEFNLKDMTEDILMGLTHPKKNMIEVFYEVEAGCFDGSKVKQVLTNLLRNALIYTPENAKVELKWYTTEDHELCVQVQDWGSGIPESEHNRIFERFYRVGKNRSRTSGGFGIGLSIVKHIMNLHSGDVRLAPYKEGEGARFICTFPQ